MKDHYSHLHVGVYDRGGLIPPGLSIVNNKTGHNEVAAVFNPRLGGGEHVSIHFDLRGAVIDKGAIDDLAAKVESRVIAGLKRNGRKSVSTTR